MKEKEKQREKQREEHQQQREKEREKEREKDREREKQHERERAERRKEEAGGKVNCPIRFFWEGGCDRVAPSPPPLLACFQNSMNTSS